MAASAETDDVARQAMAELLALPGVGRAGLALVEGGGRRLRFTASDRGASHDVDWCHIDAYDDVPLTQVVRDGAPVLGSLADLETRFPGVVARQRDEGTAALAALPLVAAGAPIGGVVLFYGEPQPFDAAQLVDLASCAERWAHRIRVAHAHGPRRPLGRPARDLPDDARAADLALAPEPRAVGEARRFARRTLAGWGVTADDVVDAVLLCLSELATNAVVHTERPSDVRLLLEGETLTVSVRDQGAARWTADVRAQGEADPLEVHGRGLRLVQALAARWGSELDVVGSTVWFEVAVPAPPGGRS